MSIQIADLNVPNGLEPATWPGLGLEERRPALHSINRMTATRMTSEFAAWFVSALQQYRLPIERNVIVPDPLQQLLEIRAAQLVELPLRYMAITEQCGRVYLLNIVPVEGTYEPEPATQPVRIVNFLEITETPNTKRTWRDPEVPVCLLQIGGQFDRATVAYVKHLNTFTQALSARQRNAIHEWWSQAHRLCHACLDGLAWGAERAGMCVEEVLYMAIKLQRPLAWPQGTELITAPQAAR